MQFNELLCNYQRNRQGNMKKKKIEDLDSIGAAGLSFISYTYDATIYG